MLHCIDSTTFQIVGFGSICILTSYTIVEGDG